jgi:thiamine biosynthesis lipoprotein
MGTIVGIRVLQAGAAVDAAIERAFGWFHEIEARCTRFSESSELMQLTARACVAVPASPVLFEAVRFALMIAEESGGAFDPTVGGSMQSRGFDRHHVTGETLRRHSGPATYRDVVLDDERRTITLLRPLTLDLGAVAKGLAIDTAAQELAPFRDFAIDAGGDLYLGGTNERGEPWSVGIRHPRDEDAVVATVRASDQAVCTSGDYEREMAGSASEHHIVDPRTGCSPPAVASVTVIGPGAMLADALATAAFVLGPAEGVAFLTRLGVEGLIVTPDLRFHHTEGLTLAA